MQCKGKPLRCNFIRPEKRKILISRLIVPGHESAYSHSNGRGWAGHDKARKTYENSKAALSAIILGDGSFACSVNAVAFFADPEPVLFELRNRNGTSRVPLSMMLPLAS